MFGLKFDFIVFNFILPGFKMFSNYLICSYNCSMFTCKTSFELRSLFVLLDFPLTLQLNICRSTRKSNIFYIPNGSNAKAFCRFNGWFCRIEKILIILSKQKINSYRFSNGISVALSSVPYCKRERQFNPVFDFASRGKSLRHLSLETKIPNNMRH